MKLYLLQHVFTFGDKFVVYDESEAERYYVEGEVFSFGKKLHVYNAHDEEVALIKHPMKIIFMSPRKAALSIVQGVWEASDYRTWIGPALFDVWGMPRVKALRTATDAEVKRIDQTAREIYRRLCEK